MRYADQRAHDTLWQTAQERNMQDWNPEYRSDWQHGYSACLNNEDYDQCNTQGWKDGYLAAQEQPR